MLLSRWGGGEGRTGVGWYLRTNMPHARAFGGRVGEEEGRRAVEKCVVVCCYWWKGRGEEEGICMEIEGREEKEEKED